jgi:hypothetical protein
MLRLAALALLGACAARPQPDALPRMYYCGSGVTENVHDGCHPAQPYDSVLVRYLRTHDIHAVASELGLSDDGAKELIADAMHHLYIGFWHRDTM